MRTIAIANQKGGCGKTTVSVNLAAALALAGRRVLLADMDPQGHCAVGLAVPEEQINRTIADVLLQDQSTGPIEIEQAVWQVAGNFDLLPATLSLVRFETMVSDAENRDLYLKLALDAVSQRYDYCIVDTPPHVGLLTYNAMRAADEVMIPVDTGYFALQGLEKAIETLKDLNSRTGQGIRIHVLPNGYDVRTRLAREILNELRRRYDAHLLESYVNFNSKLKEAASVGQSINEYDPTSMGCRDFGRLANELIEMENQAPDQDALISHAERLSARAEELLATRAHLVDHRSVQPAPSADTATSTPASAPRIPPTPVPTEAVTIAPSALAEVGIPSLPAQVSAPVEPMPSTPITTPDTVRAATQTAVEKGGPQDNAVATAIAPEANAPSPVPVAPGAPTAAPNHERIEQEIERLYGIKQTTAGIEFHTNLPGAREVLLAGDFNNWSPRDSPMDRCDGNGHFQATLRLDKGRYRYRLVVDGRWQKDPCNEMTEVNEFGEINSIAEVQ